MSSSLAERAVIHQLKISACGRNRLESRAAQEAREQVALGLEECRQPGPGVGAGGEIARNGVLQRGDDAEGVELMHLAKFRGSTRGGATQ